MSIEPKVSLLVIQFNAGHKHWANFDIEPSSANESVVATTSMLNFGVRGERS